MLNNKDIEKIIPAVRKTVAFVLGHNSPDIEDITNDTIVSLCANAGGFRGDASLKSYATITARNAALNWRALHSNSRRGASVNGTDYSDGEGEGSNDPLRKNPDGVIVGDDSTAFAGACRDADLSALDDAIAALEPDEQTFMRAMLDGATVKDAGALVGWSAPTATRKRAALIERLASMVGR